MQNLLKEAIRRKRRGIMEVDPEEIERDIAALEGNEDAVDAEDAYMAEVEGVQESDDVESLDEEEEIEREEEDSGDLSPTVRDEGEGTEAEEQMDPDQEAIIFELTGDVPEDVLKRKPNKSLTERVKEQAYLMAKQSKKGKV